MTSRDGHPSTPHTPPLRVYGWTQGAGGTYWYRIAEPFRGLTLLGHHTSTGAHLNDEIVDASDVIVVHMLHEQYASNAWQKLARLKHRKTLVLDIDDDVWNFDPRTDTHRFWTDERLLRLQSNIAVADIVTTPSEYLADILRPLNPNTVVLGNYVPRWLLSHRPVRPAKFTIGYQGARQHTLDLQEIAPDVWEFLNRHRRTRVHIYGELNPVGWPRVIRTPWNPCVPDYYRSLSMTVGIGPLAPIPFNYAKSAVRAVEYAALGIPCILSDVPAYRPYVHPRYSGWLIPHGAPWLDVLEYAYAHPEKLAGMGQTGRRMAMDWTTERNAHRWESVYRG